MKNTSQIKLEINIDSDKKIVQITGRTIIDGKDVINYEKKISECEENGIYFDDLIEMLMKPVDMDKRFKGVMGIEKTLKK